MKRDTMYQERYRVNHPWARPLHSARQRCGNKNNSAYKNYGGRGIKCFLTMPQIQYLFERDGGWQMIRPSIDRINNDGNYTVRNCRFLELSENIREGLKVKKIITIKMRGLWMRSGEYNMCSVCKRPDKPHRAKGMCSGCVKIGEPR